MTQQLHNLQTKILFFKKLAFRNGSSKKDCPEVKNSVTSREEMDSYITSQGVNKTADVKHSQITVTELVTDGDLSREEK
jgi:hypothetical protein